MVDNTTLNPGSGGDVVATDDIGGVKVQRVKVQFGDDGAATDASYTQPFPVKLTSLGDTFFAVADAVAFAASKSHLSIINTSATKIVKVRKLFAVNLTLTSVTGVAVRFDIKRATAHSAGTAITPEKSDPSQAALDAGITVKTGATVTEGNLLWPFITTNDEAGATNAFPTNVVQQFGNLMLEGPEITELTVRQNDGMTVKQITSTTVGSFAWILAFTVE